MVYLQGNIISNLVVVCLEIFLVPFFVLRSAGVHNRHEEIGGVLELRTEKAEIFCEVTLSLGCGAVVDESALNQEHQSVEQGEDFRVGLMDRQQNGLPFAREVSEEPHNDEGSQRVHPRSGFVEDDHCGVADEFARDRSPLFLSPRNTLHQRSSHQSVQTLFQLHFFH